MITLSHSLGKLVSCEINRRGVNCDSEEQMYRGGRGVRDVVLIGRIRGVMAKGELCEVRNGKHLMMYRGIIVHPKLVLFGFIHWLDL